MYDYALYKRAATSAEFRNTSEIEPACILQYTIFESKKRFGDTSGNSRVRVSTRDGSAISGVDYEPKSEMLRFLPNMNDITFTITVKVRFESNIVLLGFFIIVQKFQNKNIYYYHFVMLN